MIAFSKQNQGTIYHSDPLDLNNKHIVQPFPHGPVWDQLQEQTKA